jgi:small subunit ribosomal protein S6
MTEGYYVLVNYTAEPSFVAELERIFNITEGVMRSMTTRA